MKIKKFTAALLAALMLAGAATVTASAETAVSSYGESVLTGADLKLYEKLNAHFSNIAAAGGSTCVTVTAAELGTVDSSAVNISKVIDMLLVDLPYELYWYDKVSGMKYSTYTEGETGNLLRYEFLFCVADGYRADGYDNTKPAVKATEIAVVATAKAVVEQYKSLSDPEKLKAYKNYICEQVAYNTEAAENSQTPYGNPWQMIWVFDGDTTTNVVCEGYAKAFKYLCDLSTFESEDFACYLVDGLMLANQESGPHMWNVVTLNNVNYLVDVTNSDEKMIGQDGKLFMNSKPNEKTENYFDFTPPASNEPLSEYVKIEIPEQSPVSYYYDPDTIDLYSTAILKLGTIRGDFDLDGEIGSQDIQTILSHLRGETKLKDDALIRADYNRDGKVNARDCILMMRNRTTN